MAGYRGYSMSNNAVDAYESGEKPISKWTKSEIIEAIMCILEEEELTLNCNINNIKKMPLKVLKDVCLYCSSWHHTSKHYNKTDFYSIDINKVLELTDDKIIELVAKSKEEKPIIQTEEKWKCAFLEWSGTRNHPKATEIIEIGIVKGNWFYRKDGSKKKTTSNGFRFIERV